MAREADDSVTDPQPFVPILTVMVDYGNAPFLWCVDDREEVGVGGNVCDGTGWDENCPMSEGLWRKFADWAIEFDRTSFYSEDCDVSGWDWAAFHERGLQLSRWLKEEVGNAYRVVYVKPCEDLDGRMDERREVLADGTVVQVKCSWLSIPADAKRAVAGLSRGRRVITDDRAGRAEHVFHGAAGSSQKVEIES